MHSISDGLSLAGLQMDPNCPGALQVIILYMWLIISDLLFDIILALPVACRNLTDLVRGDIAKVVLLMLYRRYSGTISEEA
jgi:hypothetical protein